MSEYVVKLPDVGEGIAEAEIVEWHVNVGDTITEDQVMVEVMTDKATVELPSPVAGVVTSVGAAVGEVLQVGSPLIRIETAAGAEPHEIVPLTPSKPTEAPVATNGDVAPETAPSALPAPPAPAATAAPGSSANHRAAAAAPAVRQRAKNLGIDLADVMGTDPMDGRTR